MTTRDELADLIWFTINEYQVDCALDQLINPHECELAAQAILSRWRLVPVEEDLRTERIKLHYEGFSDRQIAERQGMSTRTIAAWRRKSGLQYNDGKQHRAADELTQHDQAVGVYGLIPAHPKPCSTCDREPPKPTR